jgi:hypothetical protein
MRRSIAAGCRPLVARYRADEVDVRMLERIDGARELRLDQSPHRQNT